MKQQLAIDILIRTFDKLSGSRVLPESIIAYYGQDNPEITDIYYTDRTGWCFKNIHGHVDNDKSFGRQDDALSYAHISIIPDDDSEPFKLVNYSLNNIDPEFVKIMNDIYLNMIGSQNPKELSNNTAVNGTDDVKVTGTYGGQKYDGNKPKFGLVPPDAMRAVAEVMTQGATKYSANNWVGLELSRVTDALERHVNAFQSGEDYAADSKQHHLAHAIANAMMAYHLAVNYPKQDDRLFKNITPKTNAYPLRDKND